MAPIVKELPTYVKNTNHVLEIFNSFTFSSEEKYLFTIDIKSLYTVISNNDGLQALKFYLDLRP